MRMSDLVARYILEMLEKQDGNAEIQRNELAGSLGCVPSQINYVITSRFTPEQGYIVKADRSTALMHIINAIGKTIDKSSVEIMIKNMLNQSIIDERTARLMMGALSERSFSDIPQEIRNSLRANIFKNMLLTLYE